MIDCQHKNCNVPATQKKTYINKCSITEMYKYINKYYVLTEIQSYTIYAS